MNRRTRPTQLLSLVRRLARRRGVSVVELPGRGKGRHRLYALAGSDGSELARFGLTDHPEEISWPLPRRLEAGLAPWFGEKWTEKR